MWKNKEGRKQDGRQAQVGEEAPKLTRGNRRENPTTGVSYCRPMRTTPKAANGVTK